MTEYTSIVYDYLHRNMQLPKVYTFNYKDLTFIGMNTVFSPVVFEDTFWFAENIPFLQDSSFLEIGCGTGLLSVLSILKGCRKALASDINPNALINTKLNTVLHKVDHKIDILSSNVFDEIAIHSANKFSLIFWNVPFIYSASEHLNFLEKSVFDTDYKGIQQYIERAKYYIEHSGRIFMGFSSSSGNKNFLNDICIRNNAQLKLHAECLIDDFSLELYEIIYS
ncbi:MAG: hypothetical protein RLZZ628_3242 [Bacteroidota bacterium]|jgi:16S rRNA G1207 methylase RsmC